MFGQHGNAGGRPASADYSHNTSSSNSPVNCRGTSDYRLHGVHDPLLIWNKQYRKTAVSLSSTTHIQSNREPVEKKSRDLTTLLTYDVLRSSKMTALFMVVISNHTRTSRSLRRFRSPGSLSQPLQRRCRHGPIAPVPVA